MVLPIGRLAIKCSKCKRKDVLVRQATTQNPPRPSPIPRRSQLPEPRAPRPAPARSPRVVQAARESLARSPARSQPPESPGSEQPPLRVRCTAK